MGLFDMFKKKEEPKQVQQPEYISGYKYEPQGKTAKAKFNASGLKYENRDKRLVAYMKESGRQPYMGMSDKEIINYPWSVFEYAVDGTDTEMKLLPEPDNKHDPNAIRIYLGGEEMGFVPAKDCQRVKKAIDAPHTIWWCVRGGNTKRYDEYSKKIKSFSDEVGLQIKIYKE